MFDAAKFLEALTGGVFATAVRLAVEKAGGKCGKVNADAGGLWVNVFDGDRVVDRVHLGMVERLWRPVTAEDAAKRVWEVSPAVRALPAATPDPGRHSNSAWWRRLQADPRVEYCEADSTAPVIDGRERIRTVCEVRARPGCDPADLAALATPPRLPGHQRQLNVSQGLFDRTLRVVCIDTEIKVSPPDVGPDP